MPGPVDTCQLLTQACEAHCTHPAHLHQSLVLHPRNPAASGRKGQKKRVKQPFKYKVVQGDLFFRAETSEHNESTGRFGWSLGKFTMCAPQAGSPIQYCRTVKKVTTVSCSPASNNIRCHEKFFSYDIDHLTKSDAYTLDQWLNTDWDSHNSLRHQAMAFAYRFEFSLMEETWQQESSQGDCHDQDKWESQRCHSGFHHPQQHNAG